MSCSTGRVTSIFLSAASTSEPFVLACGNRSQAQAQGQVKVKVKGKAEPESTACTGDVVTMPIPYCSLSLLVLPYTAPVS